MDTWQVLRKIEALVERLPYRTALIEIKTVDDTYALNKARHNVCGFAGDLKEGGGDG